ncbi:hypothetical protein IJG92_01975, partial [Candidatus Saccharibacteria bacterium]|nr:hypothetical protein [Candidatus Saccharibacteria bacterium]
TVGTNNATGYKTIMTSSSGNTDLVETTDNTLTIPTLASGSYSSPSDFPANHWGYKKDSGSYIPFAINTTILESDTYANDDTTTLSFGTKIDYLQASGTYKTTLVFTTTVNPLVTYIQDFTTTMCQEKASSADYAVVDKRDGQEYTVRYINGNCWMTQNLRYVGDTGSTSGSMIMKATTSNISVDATIAYADFTAGDSYTTAELTTGVDNNSDPTVWYNYVAASAATITGASNTATQVYDICPTGWRLPNNNEQSATISYKAQFNPVSGGVYNNGNFNRLNNGFWWASTIYTTYGAGRYGLFYDSNNLSSTYCSPYYVCGGYVRCIAKY